MIRVAVCDDDSAFIDYFESLLSDTFSDNGDIFEIKSFNYGSDLLNIEDDYDLLFLDIDMPEVSGFEIASALKERNKHPFLIFVTSHDELVYSSFKFQPFRFLRKSYLDKELPEILNEVTEAINEQNMSRKTMFKTKNGSVYIELKKIYFIEIYSHKLLIHSADGIVTECTGTLSDYEEKFNSLSFIRTHKSYLVNMRLYIP